MPTPSSDMPTVVIENSVSSSSNISQLKEIANVVIMDPYAKQEDWINVVKDAVVIVDRKAKLTREILEAAGKLKMVARTGIGVDNTRIHLETAIKKRLLVTYNPGINSDSVAELTLLHALSLYRRMLKLNDFVRKTQWNQGQMTTGNEIKNKTWGLIGFGRIGVRVAEILHAFGVKVVAYDPFLSAEKITQNGASPKRLNDLLVESDIVSLHVPLMETTYHLIGKNEFELMKQNSVIINTSRGGIIDETALYDALLSKKLLGAGLDTLETEPITADNPLLSLENVVITPHIGGSTFEGISAGSYNAITEVIRFLRGEEPIHLYPLKYEGEKE